MTSRLSLFALALVLPLAACETEPDTVETDSTVIETTDPMLDEPMMEDDMMTDDPATAGTPEVTPQGTVDAVQQAGGLTSLSVAAATQNIDGWITRLEGNPDFEPVVADLRTLRGQLQASPIDGAAVGATLQSLGEATTAAAAGDGALTTLGQTLTDAGNQLAGGM